MSNVVKQKKLTKRIALRIPHATWRGLVKQARLLALTPSELVREAIHHYQGHLRPLTEFTKSAAAGPDPKAIERDMAAAIWQRKAEAFASWPGCSTPFPTLDERTPKAQPPGPSGGAGFASVQELAGGKEVSVASPKRNRR